MDGWREIVQRCADELHIDVGLLEVDEDNGRLRIGISEIDLSPDVRRSFVLAQFRSLYTCSVCGRPGRHLRPLTGPRITRCVEHTPPKVRDAVVIYDEKRVPWREMSDGTWQYDVAEDTLTPKT